MRDRLIELLKKPNKTAILRKINPQFVTDETDEESIVADYLLANDVIVLPCKVGQKVISDTPTADVIEVVRCENCKHLTIHNSPTLYAYCEKTHYRFEPFETDTRTHFCGFGELKEREGK